AQVVLRRADRLPGGAPDPLAGPVRRHGAGAGSDRRRHHRRHDGTGTGLLGGGPPAANRLLALLRRRHAGRRVRYGPLLPHLGHMTLSILIWIPLAVSLVASQLPAKLVARISILGSIVTLGVAVSFLVRFKTGHSGLQFVTDRVWISALGIHYKLGLDGLNVALVVLTTVLFSAALIWSAFREWDRPRTFYFHFGLAQSAVLGAFCAQDLALFVAFFDLMLIPFYFLIGMWGSGERIRATTKLVVYTLVGSFFMLAGAIATGVLASDQNGTSLTLVLSSPPH